MAGKKAKKNESKGSDAVPPSQFGDDTLRWQDTQKGFDDTIGTSWDANLEMVKFQLSDNTSSKKVDGHPYDISRREPKPDEIVMDIGPGSGNDYFDMDSSPINNRRASASRPNAKPKDAKVKVSFV